MLSKQDPVATIAVKNLAAAKKFYEGTLGLKQIDAEGDEVVVYESGKSRINVYRSQYAGTNKATVVTWPVDDVEGESGMERRSPEWFGGGEISACGLPVRLIAGGGDQRGPEQVGARLESLLVPHPLPGVPAQLAGVGERAARGVQAEPDARGEGGDHPRRLP